MVGKMAGLEKSLRVFVHLIMWPCSSKPRQSLRCHQGGTGFGLTVAHFSDLCVAVMLPLKQGFPLLSCPWFFPRPFLHGGLSEMPLVLIEAWFFCGKCVLKSSSTVFDSILYYMLNKMQRSWWKQFKKMSDKITAGAPLLWCLHSCVLTQIIDPCSIPEKWMLLEPEKQEKSVWAIK